MARTGSLDLLGHAPHAEGLNVLDPLAFYSFPSVQSSLISVLFDTLLFTPSLRCFLCLWNNVNGSSKDNGQCLFPCGFTSPRALRMPREPILNISSELALKLLLYTQTLCAASKLSQPPGLDGPCLTHHHTAPSFLRGHRKKRKRAFHLPTAYLRLCLPNVVRR